MSSPRAIGIFGGTFDPPHNSHVRSVIGARDELSLELILVIPANDPWQKTASRTITPSATRLKMTRAAFSGIAGVSIDTREIDRGGVSYTVDTLREIAAEQPGFELTLLVGVDVARRIDTWRSVDEIAELCSLTVILGPHEKEEEVPFGGTIRFLHLDDLGPDHSSEVRDRVAAGESIDGLVPPDVVRCIRDERLYIEV